MLFIIILSCNNNLSDDYKKDSSGVEYKYFIHNINSEKPKYGDILVLSMTYSTNNDSIIFDTRDFGNNFKMRFKTDTYRGGSINDCFNLLNVGDSASFLIDAELFYINSKNQDPPKFIKKGSKLKFNIKLLEIFSYDKYKKEHEKEEFKDEKEEDMILKSFIQNQSIKQKPTSSGLYYIEKKKGTGRSPKPGDILVVNYTGTLISGKVFDSTLSRNEPFQFVYGKGEVIQGWEEGLSYMKEGGKAELIIPSHLAYGKDGYTGLISPYSTLIFDIELVKIIRSNNKN